MNSQIKDDFQKIFLNVFQSLKPDDFGFDKSRTDFENWDSLAHMQLVSETENFFNVSFEIDEVVGINSPQDLVNLIEKKKNAR